MRDPQPSRRQRLAAPAIALLIVLATCAAYAPAWHGEFIWDDTQYVRDNLLLRSLRGLWDIWFDPMATPQYDPLTFSSFWVEYHLWGLQPLGYHLNNVVLHVANALLLWCVLGELGLPGGPLAAAVFALHPVHVESVAWIVERKNLLSGLFALATIWAWARLIAPHGRAAGRRRLYALALALFACTLLSKPVLCTLPVALWLLVWWKRPLLRWRALAALLPLVALSLAASRFAVWREQHGNPPLPLSVLERLLIMNRAVWFYAGKLLWPTNLTPIYPRWGMQATPWSVVLLVATIALVVVLWLLRRRFGKGPLVAAGAFAGTLLPLLGAVDFGFMQYSFVADHFQYLPSAALIAAAAVAAGRALQRRAGRTADVALCGLIGVVGLGVLGGLSWHAAANYASAEIFWRDALANNPQAWKAHTNLAGTLARAGKLDEAISHYAAAVQLRPDFPEAHNHWGIVLSMQGKPDEALQQFEIALRQNPAQADAHNNAGTLLAQQGKWDEAAAHFAAAVQINPTYFEALDSWGIVALQQGKIGEAVAHFEAALQAKPDYAPARQHLERARSLLATRNGSLPAGTSDARPEQR